MKYNRSHLLAVSAALVLFSAPANAVTLVSYGFQGTVRDIVSTTLGQPSAATLSILSNYGVNVGADMTGGFTADIDVADSDPDPTRGYFLNATQEGFFNVGTFDAEHRQSGFDSVVIRNDSSDPFHDIFATLFSFSSNAAEVDLLWGGFQLRDSDEDALSDDAYPVEGLLPLSQWDEYQTLDFNGTGFFVIARVNGETVHIISDISSLDVARLAPVPIPASGMLFVFALGAFATFARKRSSSS